MVAPLDVMPASGDGMWIAARTNYSDMRLTHAFDLRGVSAASLRYDVHHDIELGYDFAYVSVSTDGGQTWQGLEAANMQGQNPSVEDPADVAFTARYYTGQSDGWRTEQIDLSPFAGQEILVRFRYITDPILTFPGIGIDNVAVPEISFYDAMENAAPGWQAEGFVHSTALIPQEWQLQLITFPSGQEPQVQLLAVNQGRVSLPLDFSQSNGEVILAVAASSPMTLTPAFYEVGLE
jgi:bacillopeptidase F (M6 metalloprotease family)